MPAKLAVKTNIDNSARNRPQELGGPAAANAYADADSGSLEGRTLTVEQTAQLVLDGIVGKRLYIHTHKEARSFLEGRARRIAEAFDHAL